MSKRRLFVLLLGIMTILAGWTGRLFWVQIIAARGSAGVGPDLVRSSVLQREKTLVIDSGRGDFYDAVDKPLTGEVYPALVLFPVKRSNDEQNGLEQVRKAVGAESEAWGQFLESLTEPQFWNDGASGHPMRLSNRQAEQIRELHVPGTLIAQYNQRYLSPYSASQLIGFIGEDPDRISRDYASMLEQGRLSASSRIGGSGLERTFQPFLQGIGGRSLSLFVDGEHHVLQGLEARIFEESNPNYPLRVITTLHLDVQRQLEKAADRVGLKEGAIVVLDADNADVVAMVNRPSFDPERVNLTGGAWENRAIHEITPGSVFKTVVAAAALDNHLVRPDEKFECRGELGKYGFSCWKPGGHGIISFEEAFAESCNITFAKVMERIPSETLKETARKLGMLQPVGWHGDVLNLNGFRQFDGEQAGSLFAAGTDPEDDGVRVQTSIGQRDVRISPLQAANLVVTLLHGGKVLEPRTVREVRYQTGRLMADFPTRTLVSASQGISPQTANQLLKWMREVVDHGTAASLKNAVLTSAGKTGTAQTTVNGKDAENQWFVGYFPVDHPRYAIAIVAENEPTSGGAKALKLMRETMNAMAPGIRS